MLPQVNAMLSAIIAGASVQSSDWDVSASSGSTLKWQGNSDAYVIEKTKTTFAENEGGLRRAKDVSIVIPASLLGPDGSPLTLEEGDVFNYTFRTVNHSRKVMSFDAPYLPGMGVAEYVHVYMTTEPVEDPLEQQ